LQAERAPNFDEQKKNREGEREREREGAEERKQPLEVWREAGEARRRRRLCEAGEARRRRS